MKRLFLIIFSFMIFINGNAHILFFQAKDTSPICNVRCVGFTAKLDSIGCWISNNNGVVNITSSEIDFVHVSHPNYNERLIYISQSTNDTIILSPHIALNEVVVTPDDVHNFSTHTSFRISSKEMERYPNVLLSLNEIPNLTVLQNGGVFFEGNPNIKILIDGVEATLSEIQSLSKEDISKVDIYQVPPIRFLSQGVESVIDIRLKSKLHGGNGALDLNQAFLPLKGNNSAGLYYNYKQSRFSLLFNNENRHYKKFCQSEVLNYNFGGSNYYKLKTGQNSKKYFDDNDLKLSYQYNISNNFLYNIKMGVAFNHNGYNAIQNVSIPEDTFLANNSLYSKYIRYNIGNYIEKQLKNGSSILGNINYQHYTTEYNSCYREFSESSNALQDSHSNYNTNLDALFSEVQYQFPKTNFGFFSLSTYETYKHSKYINTSTSFYQKTNITGLSAQWMGSKYSFRWYLTMGVDWYRTSSTLLEKSHNLVIPSPMINLNWRPNRLLQISLDYAYSGAVPSISQLSETNQWIDTKLVYHGNSTLKPYRTHSVGIRFVYNNKFINLALRGSYASSPDMICDMYTIRDEYMLQTLVNLDKYSIFSSQLDFTIKPLGNNFFTFWNRIIFSDLKGKNQEYSWDGSRFQWMSDLALNLKHWTVDLFYQYPGKIVEGQLNRPRAECWSATVWYRPNTNISIGIEWFMPFGKGFKESEYTVNSAPVYADSEYMIKDRANMISLKFSYNFNFGRNNNNAQPQFDNIDNDSGILQK